MTLGMFLLRYPDFFWYRIVQNLHVSVISFVMSILSFLCLNI